MRISELNRSSLKNLEDRAAKARSNQDRKAAKQSTPVATPVQPEVKPIDKLMADGLPDAWLLDDGTAIVMPNFVHDDKKRRKWIQTRLNNEDIPLYRKVK